VVRAARAADAAFSQRRKTLRNSLSSALGVEPGLVEQTLRDAGFDPAARGETLPVDAYVTLGEALRVAGCLP
jgi:16S rRNA (adenine1518-N6/adenine1519-N6)-dimethyltransferase